MRRNSVLDELRVKRLAVAVVHEEIFLQSILKICDARLKIRRIEGEEELSIVSIEVMV